MSISRTSSVIAIASTPSLKASSLAVFQRGSISRAHAGARWDERTSSRRGERLRVEPAHGREHVALAVDVDRHDRRLELALAAAAVQPRAEEAGRVDLAGDRLAR